MEPERPNRVSFKWLRVAGQASFIPIFLAFYPIAFFGIGWWLDQQFDTQWIRILFLFLGLISGFRQTYFLIKKIIISVERDERGS